MEFSEANNPWRDVPSWASYLIEFGYAWMTPHPTTRRIALVSMPADSAGAGLVTLGVMRKYMELDDANDVGSHYQRLLELAQLNSGDVVLRRAKGKSRERFAFDGIDANGVLWVRKLNVKLARRETLLPESAINWTIDGEAPVIITDGQRVPNAELYSSLVAQGGEIKASNLSESHSDVCLVGRATGEKSTRSRMTNIRFRENGRETDLSHLLTIQNWMPGTISRALFYNARTESFDRDSGRPRVVIADGDASFLKALGRADFEDCDVIGIIHRTIERDRLEAVGAKLASLRQWYDADDSLPSQLLTTPRGVSACILRRRA
jgi:hypothetical protein